MGGVSFLKSKKVIQEVSSYIEDDCLNENWNIGIQFGNPTTRWSDGKEYIRSEHKNIFDEDQYCQFPQYHPEDGMYIWSCQYSPRAAFFCVNPTSEEVTTKYVESTTKLVPTTKMTSSTKTSW